MLKAEREMSVEQYFKSHGDDLKWVCEMAQKGIRVTEGAGDHPANVFLYELECNLEDVNNNSGLFNKENQETDDEQGQTERDN